MTTTPSFFLSSSFTSFTLSSGKRRWNGDDARTTTTTMGGGRRRQRRRSFWTTTPTSARWRRRRRTPRGGGGGGGGGEGRQPPAVVVARCASEEDKEDHSAAYAESFDAQTGQMVKTLTQSIETVDVSGQTWTQRRGRPPANSKEGTTTTTTEKKEHPIVFIHGVGSCAYTFRQVSVLLQEKGYETYAPDVVGHGDSEKSNGFKYDEKSYVEAMEAYVEKVGNGKQVDLVAHGFIIPQYAILLARKRPDLFRRMVLMNTPLDGNHNLAPPLATYTQMFGRGKGKPFDAVSLNYMGNEFAIPGDDLKEYERAYVGSDAENARMAVEMTVTNADFKNLKKKVKDAYFQGGMPKTRIVWGVADKYLDQAPMFSWASDVRASEKALRKVGHMPQEDYPQVVADAVDEFLASDLKVSALGSVRGRKVLVDDGQG